MAILLKDALRPNLVQTIGGTPAFVHCGPFANIAHGCNSVQATKLAMSYAPYTVTEAGFGADLGAEKFLDVKCRMSGLKPNAVVIVATVRALKLNGGADKNNLASEDLDALNKGMCNLLRHVSNIKDVYRLPCIVAINRFTGDTESEIAAIENAVNQLGIQALDCCTDTLQGTQPFPCRHTFHRRRAILHRQRVSPHQEGEEPARAPAAISGTVGSAGTEIAGRGVTGGRIIKTTISSITLKPPEKRHKQLQEPKKQHKEIKHVPYHF